MLLKAIKSHNYKLKFEQIIKSRPKLILKIDTSFVAMDGGSPLACNRNGRFELTGLVTFGTSCPHDRSPSLFTRVTAFSAWVRDNYLNMKRR
jgi:secreted trypsin-like serine protease